MKFDLMRLIFMVVAIIVGNMLGPMLAGTVGVGGGLLGAFVSGLLIYAIYSMLSKTKMSMFGAIIFAVAVYVSVIVTGVVSGYFGMVTGIIATFVQAVILSLILSYMGPQGTSVPVSMKGQSSKTPRKRRRRR